MLLSKSGEPKLQKRHCSGVNVSSGRVSSASPATVEAPVSSVRVASRLSLGLSRLVCFVRKPYHLLRYKKILVTYLSNVLLASADLPFAIGVVTEAPRMARLAVMLVDREEDEMEAPSMRFDVWDSEMYTTNS